MGYIKEPAGVDFFVENRIVSPEDKRQISDIIAYYKATGKKKAIANKTKSALSALNKKNLARS